MSNHTAPVSGQKPSEPVKKKRRLTAAIVLGVIAAAAGIAAACWFFLRTPSFQTPMEALTACLSQLGEQFSKKELGPTALEEKLDTSSMLENIKENGQTTDLSITLEHSDISELSLPNNITADYSFQNDVKNQRTKTTLSAFFMGFGGDIGIYADKDSMAFFSDEFLSDTLLSLQKKDLEKFLKEHIPDQESSYMKSLLEHQYTQVSSGLRDFSEYAAKQLPSSLLSFAKQWTIEESDKEHSLTIGPDTYDCHTYKISITSRAFKEFLKEYNTWLLKYDYNSNSFFCMLDEIYRKNAEGSIQDQMKELLMRLPDKINEDSQDRLDLIMYVSPKGRLLGSDLNFTYGNEGVSFELRFGGKKPGQDIYLDINGLGSSSSFDYNFSSTHTADDYVETSLTKMDFTLNEKALMQLEARHGYNPDEDSFDTSLAFSGTMGDKPVSAKVTANGHYKNINKGKSYKLVIDRLSLNMDGENVPFSSMEFSADIFCGVLSGPVKTPKGTSYDILNMSSQDVEAIVKTMKKSRIFSYLLQAVPDDTIDNYMQDILVRKNDEH